MTITPILSIFWQASVGDPNMFNNYLIMAYFIMGVIFLGYIVSLALRQRNLQQDIQLMKRILQEDEE
ncbi:MAG: hypothetical protein GY943_19600 [Chloroflexi bacterium]|nr:hypothetical protein [Chloroflexota bacterium]